MSITMYFVNEFIRHFGILLVLFALSHAIEIDNGLVGEPEVECGSNTVEMQFRTRNAFRGKVYVKGHYTNPDCRVDYTSATSSRKIGGILVNHGSCDMDRQRTISPQGMQFSAVVVVSFHPTFITKIDRAFHIKCMYREMTKTVTAGMEVSMLTTATLGQNFPMPVCTYTIRKDEIDGEILRYARVGEQVVHRWECQSEVYGILVHSCYVEDGQGDKVQIVDERGCHVDQYLLGDPTYVEALNLAYRESHVFKFADRIAVRFQCQIRLCMKDDGGCAGITPPICSDFGGIRRNELDSEESRVKRAAVIINETELGDVGGDFPSQYIYVLDTTENPTDGKGDEQIALRQFLRRASGAIVTEMGSNVCLSTMTFATLLGAVTVVFVGVTFVALVVCFSRLRNNNKQGSLPTHSVSPDSISTCYSSLSNMWNSASSK